MDARDVTNRANSFAIQALANVILAFSFFTKDIYPGELMSTVCSVHVGGWAGVGACSATII